MVEEYLQDVLDDKDVKHIGTTDYTGGNRKDAMYMIE